MLAILGCNNHCDHKKSLHNKMRESMNNINADPEPSCTRNDEAKLHEYIAYCFFLSRVQPYCEMPIAYHVPTRLCHDGYTSRSVMVLNAGRITSPACVAADHLGRLSIYPDGWTVATIFNNRVIILRLDIVLGVVAYKCFDFDTDKSLIKQSHYYTSPVSAIQDVLYGRIACAYPQHLLHAVAAVGPMCEHTNEKLFEYFANPSNQHAIDAKSGYDYLYFMRLCNAQPEKLLQFATTRPTINPIAASRKRSDAISGSNNKNTLDMRY